MFHSEGPRLCWVGGVAGYLAGLATAVVSTWLLFWASPILRAGPDSLLARVVRAVFEVKGFDAVSGAARCLPFWIPAICVTTCVFERFLRLVSRYPKKLKCLACGAQLHGLQEACCPTCRVPLGENCLPSSEATQTGETAHDVTNERSLGVKRVWLGMSYACASGALVGIVTFLFGVMLHPSAETTDLAPATWVAIWVDVLDAVIPQGAVRQMANLVVPWSPIILAGMGTYFLYWRRAAQRAGILHCPYCGYILRGLVEPRCPECGRPI